MEESESPVELFNADHPPFSLLIQHALPGRKEGKSNPSSSVSECLQTIQAL